MNLFISLQWMLDFGWLLFLLILLHHFWQERRTLLVTKNWLKAKGHITQYELSKIGNSVWPKIEYSYQVHDKNLVGEYLFLDTAHNNPNSRYARQIAYKAAIAYQENTEIDVYYNPNQPDQSALDITMPIKLTFILVLISVFLIAHLGTIVYHFLF